MLSSAAAVSIHACILIITLLNAVIIIMICTTMALMPVNKVAVGCTANTKVMSKTYVQTS